MADLDIVTTCDLVATIVLHNLALRLGLIKSRTKAKATASAAPSPDHEGESSFALGVTDHSHGVTASKLVDLGLEQQQEEQEKEEEEKEKEVLEEEEEEEEEGLPELLARLWAMLDEHVLGWVRDCLSRVRTPLLAFSFHASSPSDIPLLPSSLALALALALTHTHTHTCGSTLMMSALSALRSPRPRRKLRRRPGSPRPPRRR